MSKPSRAPRKSLAQHVSVNPLTLQRLFQFNFQLRTAQAAQVAAEPAELQTELSERVGRYLQAHTQPVSEAPRKTSGTATTQPEVELVTSAFEE
jgi:hypothetical protein